MTDRATVERPRRSASPSGWARGRATTRPSRSSTRPTSAPGRSCSAGGPTSCSPARGGPGRLAIAVAELKATPESELQVHGSGALTRWLLANDWSTR